MKRIVTLLIAIAAVFLIGSSVLSQTNGKTLIDPDTMYAYQIYSLETQLATVYLGDFTDGHTVNDIDPVSIMVNGTIPPLSQQILPSHPDFSGEVTEITLPIGVFVLGYMPFWDTTIQVYTVSGRWLTGSRCNFSVDGEVTMIGHISGDVDNDGRVDVADLVYLIEYLFRGGVAPQVPETADLDHDGAVNIADLTALVNLMFR